MHQVHKHLASVLGTEYTRMSPAPWEAPRQEEHYRNLCVLMLRQITHKLMKDSFSLASNALRILYIYITSSLGDGGRRF